MKVLVFGYSDNPERYSNKAFKLLEEHNHETLKFNPRTDDPKLLDKNVDTLTVYVNKSISTKFQDLLLGLKISRAIFNPGTENVELEEKLRAKGVEVVQGCTLVMLKTDQF